MFTSKPEHRKAVKPHTCTWCGQSIGTGERYYRWFSLDEDATMGVSKMHPECKREADARTAFLGEPEYEPFVNKRPALTTTEKAIKAQPELATVWNV